MCFLVFTITNNATVKEWIFFLDLRKQNWCFRGVHDAGVIIKSRSNVWVGIPGQEVSGYRAIIQRKPRELLAKDFSKPITVTIEPMRIPAAEAPDNKFLNVLAAYTNSVCISMSHKTLPLFRGDPSHIQQAMRALLRPTQGVLPFHRMTKSKPRLPPTYRSLKRE